MSVDDLHICSLDCEKHFDNKLTLEEKSFQHQLFKSSIIQFWLSFYPFVVLEMTTSLGLNLLTATALLWNPFCLDNKFRVNVFSKSPPLLLKTAIAISPSQFESNQSYPTDYFYSWLIRRYFKQYRFRKITIYCSSELESA